MKCIYTADWHIRFANPRMRTDDYAETMYQKARWICDLANDENAALFIAGDIFDKPACPIPWLVKYINLFKEVRWGVYTVYGQHDIHFHNSDLTRTPYGVLISSECIRTDGFDACNFGETIPDAQKYDTLMAHMPVTRYAPPFFMEDAISAKDCIRENSQWSYIITGDFHEQHVTEHNGTTLFNPGPIARADKSKMDFEPKVILHDTIKCEWEWINIPIKSDVFNLDIADADDRKDYKDKMREYAAGLGGEEAKPNFMENMRMVIKQRKPSKEVLAIIDNVLEEIA